MAATSFADYMARVSASMIHAALANAAEKAAAVAAQHHHHQQQQQQNRSSAFAPGAQSMPFFPIPLLTLPPATAQTLQNGTVGVTNGAEDSKSVVPDKRLAGKAAVSSRTKTNRNDVTGEASKETPNGRGNGTAEHLKTPNDGGLKKRKRQCPAVPTTEQPPSKQQQQLTVKAEPQPSESPLSNSRISSPDSVQRNGTGRGTRKLKLYVAEEKVDIIDYAKCIGNRAAGREFNVAESSIREWRKNEDKIRRQAESTSGCTQHFELSQPDILAWVDDALARLIDEKSEQCADWYAIATKARELWSDRAGNSETLDGSEMKITMGWVSRFMRRNEHRVPKIAPPIIATGNTPTGSGSCCSASANNTARSGAGGSAGSAGVSMVKSNPTPPSNNKQQETRSRTRAKTTTEERPQQQQPKRTPKASTGKANATEQTRAKATISADGDQTASSPNSQQPTSPVPSASSRRRKCLRPMRVDVTCATLLTTSSPTEQTD